MDNSKKILGKYLPVILVFLISLSYSYYSYAQPKKNLSSLDQILIGLNEKVKHIIEIKETPGEKGEQGINGKNGQDGSAGADGADGTQGLQGIQGEKGDTGAQGLPGDTAAVGNVSTQSITYYVSNAGSDVAGDGSVGNPFATIQYAVDSLPDYLAHECNIQLAAGTYRESIVVNKNNVDETPYLYITGNIGAPNSYRVTGADAGADTTAVRDYGFEFYGDAFFYIRGIKLDYYKKAGIYTQNSSKVRMANMNLNYCAQDNLYGAIKLGVFSYVDVRGTLNITGNGGNNEAGFYASDGQSHMYNYGTFNITIRNVKYGIYSDTQSQWITDNNVNWIIDNSAIVKIPGSAAFYFTAADHSHNFDASINNFTYGIYLDNMSLFDIDVVTYTNVDTNTFTDNGSVVV